MPVLMPPPALDQSCPVATWAQEAILDGLVIADALISVVSPTSQSHDHPGDLLVARQFGGRVLRLSFLDGPPTAWDGLPGPTVRDIKAALDFARALPADDGPRLAIHCTAGISRSTALALAIHADRVGAGQEDEAVERMLAGFFDGRLRGAEQMAAPNPLMVAFAGRLLGSGLALHQALRTRCPGYVDWCGDWARQLGGQDMLMRLLDGMAENSKCRPHPLELEL